MSYRSQVEVREARPRRAVDAGLVTPDTTVLPSLNMHASRTQRAATTATTTTTRNRLSAGSSASAGHASSESADEFPRAVPARKRLSGLPRSTSTQSGARLDAIAYSRPTPVAVASARSKTAGELGAPFGGTHVQHGGAHIRRKRSPPTMGHGATTSADSISSSGTTFDIDQDSVLGIAFPDKPRPTRPDLDQHTMNSRHGTENLPPRLIPELQALAAATVRNRPAYQQQQVAGYVSSPSTQNSDSSGLWSSRNTTPTSMSSYSPGMVQPVKVNQTGKRANTVPVPTTSKTKVQRMPVLPEALHSSSSSATGKDALVHAERTRPRTPQKKKKSLDHLPAPTPPPRSSSVKGRQTQEQRQQSNEQRREEDDSVGTLEISRLPEDSPLAKRISRSVENVHKWLTPPEQPAHRREGYFTIPSAPSRPNREGVVSLQPRRPVLVQQEKAHQPARQEGDHDASNATVRSAANDIMNTQKAPRRPLQHPALATPAMPATSKTSVNSDPNPPSAAVPQAGEVLAPAAKRLGKFSRFAIFGRRNKTEGQEKVEPRPRNVLHKGPAAGTGHEGYGKYGSRGRKMSFGSNKSEAGQSASSLEIERSRSRSQKDNRKSQSGKAGSQSDVEEFVAQRLQPVVLMGGSQRPNSNAHIPRSTVAEPPVIGMPVLATERRPDPTSSHDTHPPVLALRRSRKFGADYEQFRLPAPISTEEPRASSDMHSQSGTSSSMPQSATSTSAVDAGMHRLDPKMLNRQDKKSKFNWNIFQRSQTPSKPARPPTPPTTFAAAVPVSVSAGPMHRSVPYYALMESESELTTSEGLGDFMADVVDSPRQMPTKESAPEEEDTSMSRPRSLLLPSVPPVDAFSRAVGHPTSPKVTLQRPEPIEQPPPPQPATAVKPRRLAQVGRIPQVVSHRERHHRPDSHSFSRPFHTDMTASGASNPTRKQPGGNDDVRRVTEVQTDVRPDKPLHQATLDEAKATTVASGLRQHRRFHIPGKKEFLHFPAERQSEISTSSSSEGLPSLTATSRSLAAPFERHRISHRGEDEVWNEFDDFLDHVMSPSQPTQLGPSTPRLEGEFMPTGKHTASSASLPAETPVIIYPPPGPDSGFSEDLRLRRSRIVSALHSSVDPASPFSLAQFFAEYGDHSGSSGRSAERLSHSTVGASGNMSPAVYAPAGQQHALHNFTEDQEDAAAQSELHYASLMISRWLSFGRVLFSPAQSEISNQPERHVLVLDGLQNEDFSYYCCVSYPQTYVHSLRELDVSRSRRHLDAGSAPPNHRCADIASFNDRFPFPQTFFSVVVLRFLPAMSDRTLMNIISESKRVLAPGGYLELMLLDLDIVNMGNQTRKAIREMKIRMSSTDSDISLKPISDNVQSILGRKGFSSFSRCIVGVPVAGKVGGSIDSSSDSHSSRGSFDHYLTQQQPPPSHHLRPTNRQHGENFSLNDLIADHTPGSDDKIAKIVSRTGRFWFNHCYRAGLPKEGRASKDIFADKKMLHECKARSSSFKLLIAHTQKPAEHNRRTVSEPILPILATAGSSDMMAMTKRSV